jgi:hypothetical protein
MKFQIIKEKIINLKQNLINFLHSFDVKHWALIIVLVLNLAFTLFSCSKKEQQELQCPDASVYERCDSALVSCSNQLEICSVEKKQVADRSEKIAKELLEKNEKLLELEKETNNKRQINRSRKNSANAWIETAEPRELSNVLNSKYN